MLAAFILSASLTAAACSPIAGAERLWQSHQTRFVFLGETHGTREEPSLFGDLVCLATRTGRPVVVALEEDGAAQQAITDFMRSDGGSAARKRFLAQQMWHGPSQDGRASEAYFELFERLRLTSAEGLIQRVIAFRSPPIQIIPDEDANQQVNRGMSQALERASRDLPDALILVLTGSTHARSERVSITGLSFETAASLLPRSQRISIEAQDEGGIAWNCTAEGCGPHTLKHTPHHDRSVVLNAATNGFDGVLFIGGPVVPSPPAAYRSTRR